MFYRVYLTYYHGPNVYGQVLKSEQNVSVVTMIIIIAQLIDSEDAVKLENHL